MLNKTIECALATLTLTIAILAASGADAAPVIRQGAASAAIASSVEVPAGADLIYISGQLPPVVDTTAPAGTQAAYGDAQTQASNIFKQIRDILKAKGLGLGDVVMMRVYMIGDPGNGGKMDFNGMMAAYRQFFGAPDQPNKPARSTVQVSALAAPGPSMEIEVTAARPRP